jgi:hypothetical protein
MAKKKTNTPNAKAAITPSPLKEPHEEVRERLLPGMYLFFVLSW